MPTIKYPLGQGAAPAAQAPNPHVEVPGKIQSTLADNPGMTKIIAEFVRDLAGEVEKLRAFLEAGEMDSLRRVVHQLRGAGGGYGFESITELATSAEAAIKAAKGGQAVKAKIALLIANISRIDGYDQRANKAA